MILCKIFGHQWKLAAACRKTTHDEYYKTVEHSTEILQECRRCHDFRTTNVSGHYRTTTNGKIDDLELEQLRKMAGIE